MEKINGDDYKDTQCIICHYCSIWSKWECQDGEKDDLYDHIRKINRKIRSEQEFKIVKQNKW
jgi:hypothetical protein